MKYPVKADFKGISLSTSLNERYVSLKKNNYKLHYHRFFVIG